MPLDQENKIDDFLLGQMGEESLSAFREEMAKNKKLAKLVGERKALLKIVDAFGDLEMMEEIKAVHTEEMAKKGRVKRMAIWGMAAAIAALLALSIWFWNDAQPSAVLFSEYYEPYKISFAIRGNTENQKLAEAGYFYNSGEYGKAIPLFSAALSKEPANSKIKLALGICKMETGDLDGALSHFEKLAGKDFDLYKEHGLWYAGLVKLEKGNRRGARACFEKLAANPRSVFYGKAKNILKKI